MQLALCRKYAIDQILLWATIVQHRKVLPCILGILRWFQVYHFTLYMRFVWASAGVISFFVILRSLWKGVLRYFWREYYKKLLSTKSGDFSFFCLTLRIHKKMPAKNLRNKKIWVYEYSMKGGREKIGKRPGVNDWFLCIQSK